ncbi:hypothetical protein [Pseudomonas fragi]|uniref:hypothetical protein n=1 Tax=Pseudomonas fragi TaxID=296 RepID=UPI000BA1FB07|nr:hypothetical protein [Pseudomonas fragi]PAA13591.1 hypothetical protein CJU74_17430 [Pseudomonas fragi]
MLQSGFLNFFKINKCGLYRIAKADAQGLELAETFAELKAWADGRNFEATNPWDQRAHRNKTACYAHKIHYDPKTGDYLLVLWKGESDKQGPLYGISLNPDGTADKAIKQTQVNINKPTIWGRPCYYWIVPEINTVASIKFDNSRCDSKMFQEWITGCVNLKIPLPNYKKVTTETGLVRIQFPDKTEQNNQKDGSLSSEQPQNSTSSDVTLDPNTSTEITPEETINHRMIFSFDMSLRTISTSSAKLTDLARRVTHIIKRESVSIKNTDKREGWHRLFKRFDVPFVSAQDQSVRQVELRVVAKPTVEEIKEIIDKHATEHTPGSWEDTGFITDKSGRTIWAGSFRLSENISIDDKGDAILSVEDLYRKISENRSRYLAPILKDNSQIQTGVA